MCIFICTKSPLIFRGKLYSLLRKYHEIIIKICVETKDSVSLHVCTCVHIFLLNRKVVANLLSVTVIEFDSNGKWHVCNET